MASFLTDLMNSIFTPGPTPSLLIATNASFACLQLLFLVLLITTYSIHFLILSFLSGGLWWAINWFARELAAAREKETRGEQLRAYARRKNAQQAQAAEGGGEIAVGDDTETETEAAEEREKERRTKVKSTVREGLRVDDEALKKRRSSGGGTEASTEDEWEKVG